MADPTKRVKEGHVVLVVNPAGKYPRVLSALREGCAIPRCPPESLIDLSVDVDKWVRAPICIGPLKIPWTPRRATVRISEPGRGAFLELNGSLYGPKNRIYIRQ